MNTGTLVLGTLNGLTIGLLAVGLVLVYKSNRFLNLAHAQMGTLSALLVAKWVDDWGWNWWVALVVGIAVGVVTGFVVDRFAIRPLRAKGASPISLLLVSVGVSQVLLALTYVPALNPDRSTSASYPQPFQSHWKIGDVTLTGTSVLTMFLVPAIVIALALFLRYSLLGKQIRAAANNDDAARLCGISTSRVSALTWAIAGGMSAVSAVLQAPNQPSFNVGSLGPYLLMLTLGAAVAGAFVSLPVAFAGGLFLGLLQQIVASETSNAGKAEVAVFLAVLAIVFVRGRAISRVFASSGSPVPDRPVTRVPPALRGSPLVRFEKVWLGIAGLLLALALPRLGYFHSEGRRFLLVIVIVYAVLGVSLTMLIGWGGQVSLGHFAIIGVSTYLTAKWVPHGWSLPAIIALAGLVGAATTVAIGLPALRVRGLTLAVTTMAFAVIAPDWLFRQKWLATANPTGVFIDPPAVTRGLGRVDTQLGVYYVGLVVLGLALAAGAALRRSTPGRLFVAVRDNERATASFGVTPATVKLALLAVSGFFAAAAGVLFACAWRQASPTLFGADVSIAALAVPVVGGLGSLSGAVAGAALLYLPALIIGPWVSDLFGDFGHNLGFQLFLGGFGLITTLQYFPTGVAGVVQRAWQSFLDRRASRMDQWTTDAGMPLVVRDIHMRFGGIVALDAASIEVGPGEIVGLIGPNGAGKTTLMNVVSGTLRADSGSICVFGSEAADLPPTMRPAFGLGRSFQEATLFPGLTVTETIQVALARHNRVGVVSSMIGAPWVRNVERRTRRQADEVVERLGLSAWADALTSELSTGTRRICDLAAQVAAGPKLLLLDEPTAGVAQRDAEAFGPLLRRVRDELDCAILIVEHDMPLLMGLCDRVYAMDVGRVIAEGTPDEIRNDPVVVASYLGTEEVAIGRSGRISPERPRRSEPVTAQAGLGGME
jgi:ABC-type branched-subunit amino acid transport system ATPase component/ABC-type branched-subunit amino acid transport system permease subunit